MSEERKPSYTRGPWNSFNEFGNRGGCFGADGKTLVAMLPNPSTPADRHLLPSVDEADANFRLIDAAPDLLEALKWFVDIRYALQSKFDLFGPQDIADAMRKNFQKSLISISKAEGRSP